MSWQQGFPYKLTAITYTITNSDDVEPINISDDEIAIVNIKDDSYQIIEVSD